MIEVHYYICEVCHNRYQSKTLAMECEAYVIEPCPVAVGDKVHVYERYGDPEPDEVTQIELAAGSEIISLMDVGDDELEKQAGLIDLRRRWGWHQWLVECKESHQIGKQWTAYWFELSYIYVNGKKLKEN